jgi:hypothetical protein
MDILQAFPLIYRKAAASGNGGSGGWVQGIDVFDNPINHV